MNTRLDRMIRRARAPLSALQPVVPSVLSPEPPLREEDVQESASGQRASLNHRIPDAPAASNPARTGRVAPDPLSADALPRARAQESSPLQKPSFIYTKESILSENDSRFGRKPLSAQELQTDTLPIDVPEKPVSDATRPDPRMSVQAAPEPASKPEPHEIGLASKAARHETGPEQVARESAGRFAPPNQGLLSRVTATEPAQSLIEVNVSIGSIDFRAARPTAPARPAQSHPRVTLDNYLQRGKRDPR